jgi:hypothetical protein
VGQNAYDGTPCLRGEGKAIAAFPELRRELNGDSELFSVYALWFELLPLAKQAHRDGNDDLLRRIYGFADWCYRQRGELVNAVAVSFYEHLFDERWMRLLVVGWLAPRLSEDIHPLWEARLSSDEMREVEILLQEASRTSSR